MLVEHDALKELDDVHDLIEWSQIEGLLSGVYAKVRGERAWLPLMMFKAILLQSWRFRNQCQITVPSGASDRH